MFHTTTISGNLWVNMICNGLIALAFISIPTSILYFAHRRRDIVFGPIYYLFVGFLFVCGIGQLMAASNLTYPHYTVEVVVKSTMAICSVLMAFLFWAFMPDALKLPSLKAIAIANRELQTAQERYDTLFENSRFGVFEWRRKEGEIEFIWSQHLYAMLDLDPKTFKPTAEHFIELVHPEDREMILHATDRLQLYGDPHFLEYRLRVGDTYRWMRSRAAVKKDEEGQFLFAIGAIEDIHDVKESNILLEEEVRKRTLQLELANVTKDRFLANMSHELRTPLGLILGFSELLSGNRNLDAEGREYVELIIKNGEILSRLINDLLDLSRVEAGKLKFQWSRVRLHSLIREIEDAFAERACRKKIFLKFHYLLPDDEVLITDPIRLKQIFYNLISNAIKFTEVGGVHVTFGRNFAEENYYADVIDTGIGVEESEKQKIFIEYFRSEIVEDRKYPGSGLGLKLAKSLAHAFGGDLNLHASELGKGSHFRVTFKSMGNELLKVRNYRSASAPTTDLSKLRIAILDDNEDNLKLAQIFLKKIGCQVFSWTDPILFLQECQNVETDLVLLDIQMPKMSGFEVLERLRDQGFTKPVWALTAYGMNDDVQKILEKGFEEFIRKPIHVEKFKDKLIHEFTGPGNEIQS